MVKQTGFLPEEWCTRTGEAHDGLEVLSTVHARPARTHCTHSNPRSLRLTRGWATLAPPLAPSCSSTSLCLTPCPCPASPCVCTLKPCRALRWYSSFSSNRSVRMSSALSAQAGIAGIVRGDACGQLGGRHQHCEPSWPALGTAFDSGTATRTCELRVPADVLRQLRERQLLAFWPRLGGVHHALELSLVLERANAAGAGRGDGGGGRGGKGQGTGRRLRLGALDEAYTHGTTPRCSQAAPRAHPPRCLHAAQHRPPGASACPPTLQFCSARGARPVRVDPPALRARSHAEDRGRRPSPALAPAPP